MNTMKNLIYGLLLIFSGALLLTACGDDDDHNHSDNNEVNIIIQSPEDGKTFSMAEAESIDIHVLFEATEENHDVEVVLHPHGDHSNKIVNWDAHDHDLLIEFRTSVDLSSFESGTEFHLITRSCVNHSCGDYEEKEITFTIE